MNKPLDKKLEPAAGFDFSDPFLALVRSEVGRLGHLNVSIEHMAKSLKCEPDSAEWLERLDSFCGSFGLTFGDFTEDAITIRRAK